MALWDVDADISLTISVMIPFAVVNMRVNRRELGRFQSCLACVARVCPKLCVSCQLGVVLRRDNISVDR